MKRFLFSATIAATICMSSCDSNSNSTADKDNKMSDTAILTSNDDTTTHANPDKMTTDTDMHAAMGKQITDKDVTDFVAKAANAGMMEVELGNYATQHAKSQRVKDFGAMMVTDHTAANNELKAMAASNNIPVPAAIEAADKMHVDMMEKMEAAAFDKAYMDMMVNGHKKVRGEFQKASKDLKEEAYKTFATKTIPVLQKHLDSAMAIKKSL